MASRLVPVLMLLLAAPPLAADEPKKIDRPLNELSMEVTALQTLYRLRATPAQLEALAKLASETAQKPRDRKTAKASDEYRKTLAELRETLIAGKDDDKIGELHTKLDELRDTEEPELDDGVDLTDAARKRAPEIWALLSSRQVVSYLAVYEDEFPEPVEELLAALETGRELKGDEWKQHREEVAKQVAWLVAGWDADKAKPLAEKVMQWLDSIHDLKIADFDRKRPDLEKAARRMLGEVNPAEVIRHVVERDVAELLSNPRLAAALEARGK